MYYSTKRSHLTVMARCKNEPFVSEWARHYEAEGASRIIIIDDNSDDLSIYRELPSIAELITPVGGLGTNKKASNQLVRSTYNRVKTQTDWFLFADIDEFITSKAVGDTTLVEILNTYFPHSDCVKVPWLMMASNGLEDDPNNLLEELTYRWDHDLRHPQGVGKFRCRYDRIEVKSIFRPRAFSYFNDHHPIDPLIGNPKIVCGTDGGDAPLTPFKTNLQEFEINKAILICYHYRITSRSGLMRKIESNDFYCDYDLEAVLSSDYRERVDLTMKHKALSRRIKSG